MKYCIQCKDANSGQVGTFGFDEAEFIANPEAGFKAVTPVFDGCIDLFAWARENGVMLNHSPL